MIAALLPLMLLSTPQLGARLPAFALPDPHGAPVASTRAEGRSVVLVVTTPTAEQASAQYGWHDQLSPLGWHKDEGPLYLWLEDMSQSWFKERALAEMKKSYRPPAYFLIDDSGGLRAALGVDAGVTVVLVFDKGGVLRAVETGPPTAARAKALYERAHAGMKP